jgi:hypothetical protein
MMFDLRTSWISLKDATKLNQEKIKRFLGWGYLKQKKEKIVLSDKWVVILDYILSEII